MGQLVCPDNFDPQMFAVSNKAMASIPVVTCAILQEANLNRIAALHFIVQSELLLMVDYTQHSAGCISQNLSCDKQRPLVAQERSTFKVKLVSLQAPPPKGIPMAHGKMLNLRAVHSCTGLCQIVPLAFDQTLNQCHQPPYCCNCQ